MQTHVQFHEYALFIADKVSPQAMDFTSRKLVRRARIRRNHERQVRVAAVKSRKRAPLQPNDPLEQLLDEQEAELGLLDEISNSTYSTQSTIPSLPSLSGSQYLTASSTTSKRISNRGLYSNFKNADPSSAAGPPQVSTTPYPGHVKGGPSGGFIGLSGAMAVAGKQRQRRVRGTKRSDPFDDRILSDSNIPTETSTRSRRSRANSQDVYNDQGCGHFSDSAVSAQQQYHQLQEGGELTVVQSKRKHGRVRPQAADIKRKRARQLEKLKTYSSKIETVLEEETCSGEQRKDSSTNEKIIKQLVSGGSGTQDETKRQPVIADVLPSNPPSPALSRMVRQKTESLNISETTLQQIKEMNSHLRIVNWLWDSTQLPLGAGGGRKAKSCRGTSPSAATTVTTNSDNLVVVRRGAGANWFDLPRVNHRQEAVGRQEQLSPVSIDSDFKSDYEDELMSLV